MTRMGELSTDSSQLSAVSPACAIASAGKQDPTQADIRVGSSLLTAYSYRKAFNGFNREARNAGYNPVTKPKTKAMASNPHKN